MENQERRKYFSVVTEDTIFVRATGFILEANLENIAIRIGALIFAPGQTPGQIPKLTGTTPFCL